jgi:hypothetical protein
LVIEKGLVGLLGLIVEFSALKERGIDNVFPLSKGPLPAVCPATVLYLVRPDPTLIPIIAEQIKDHNEKGSYDHHIYFTPRKTLMCERALKQAGVYGDVQINEFKLNLVPLDSDVMSLELPGSFNEYAVHGDTSSYFYAAHAIMQIQVQYGMIPRIAGKGEAAMRVKDILLMKRKEMKVQLTHFSDVESIIIIDRAADLITPMCSQLTYEGLIDELYGIKDNYMEMPENIAPRHPQSGKLERLELNSGDKTFVELRDMNLTTIGPYISTKAKSLSREYEERHAAKTVSQIKQFTSKLKRLQDEQKSLRVHTDIAGDLMGRTSKDEDFLKRIETEQSLLYGEKDGSKSVEYIEDCICRADPMLKVLRLMCLQSLVNGGLTQKLFDFYRKEVLQTYGFEHALTLDALQKAGLLKVQEGKSGFSTVKKAFNLLVEGEKVEEDISYAYSGYAPLSVRLVQQLTQPGGAAKVEEALRYLPGPTFEEKQEFASGLKQKDTAEPSRNPTTLVFFIGGVTYSEVSALRFLSKSEGRNYVAAGTSMVNGNTLIQSCSRMLKGRRPPQPPQPSAGAGAGAGRR